MTGLATQARRSLKRNALASHHLRRTALLFTAVAVVASTAACGASSSQQTSPAAATTVPATTAAYPLSLSNCGAEVTIPAAPQRVVSLNQTTTELLLTLGVGDRVVGTSTWFDPVLPELAAANEKVPRIANNNPSLEAVLAKEPDLLVAEWRADLPGEGSTSIADLAKLDVPVYMSPEECAKAPNGSGDGRRTSPMTMDMVYQQIEEVARLVGVPERGTQVTDSVRSQMQSLTADRSGTGQTVGFWFANSESPYVAGGMGAPQIMATAVGATNVFADSQDEWPQVSWEAFAQKDPDVLVLGDLTRDRMTSETGDAKMAFLQKNTVTREMKAVKNQRFVLLKGSDMNGGLRIPLAARTLAQGLTKAEAK